MSEMEGSSSTFHSLSDEVVMVPPNVSSHLQPKSLRSLANYTKSSSKNSLSVTKSSGTPDDNSWGPELRHDISTFVAVESNLAQLFSVATNSNTSAFITEQKSHDNGESMIDSQAQKSFSRGEFEDEIRALKKDALQKTDDIKIREAQFLKEIDALKGTIEALERDNVDLSDGLDNVTKENKRLKEAKDIEVQDFQNTLEGLKLNLKEKEEDLQRTEKGRSLLLSKVGDHDTLREENASLSREISDKKNEISRLQSQINNFSSLISQMQQDFDRVSIELTASQNEVERRRNEVESKRKECEGLKDGLSLQKIDMDREFHRLETKLREMESENRRLEDSNRALQTDGNERAHSESRLKAELNTADSRIQHLEGENTSLRRRVLDVTEAKDRELSQAMTNIASFEASNRQLTDEVNQLRRTVSQLQVSSMRPSSHPQESSSQTSSMHHHHLSPHYKTYQESSQVAQPISIAQYHVPPSLATNNSNLDIYAPQVRARKDADHPAHLASSLDYNSKRANEINGISTSYELTKGSSSTPNISLHSAESIISEKNTQIPGHIGSSLNYNRQRENEIQRNEMVWPNTSTRYSSSKSDDDRSNQEKRQGQSRSLRGYAESSQKNKVISSSSSSTTQSLASLMAGGTTSSEQSTTKRGAKILSSSPFATSGTATQLKSFDELESQLTSYMTEKTSLTQELERLHQRGGKTLKDRTRFVQVEAKIDELNKAISTARRELTQKPL